MEVESCCVCGASGDLVSPEEHDAGAAATATPLRSMLLHLNNTKVVPEGLLCQSCIRRTIDAYEFSNMISSRSAPPLSEKIRALRRRLHELTQKIDVFIVVGGAGGAYGEEDVIAVERAALAAAARADAADPERARDARGAPVYQCSVCPEAFQRVAEFRAHAASHPRDALHSCWTCGAQFAARSALRDHAAAHAHHDLTCYLCNTTFQSQWEMRQHETACLARCPACALLLPDRGALARHAAATHPARLCPVCFRQFEAGAQLAAHALRHRRAAHFVCGYDACILRFATRSNLLAHIRKCHGGELPPEPAPAAPAPAAAAATTACAHCDRTFGSVAAMKRHARVHRRERHESLVDDGHESLPEQEEPDPDAEGEVEYLEVEALDEAEGRLSDDEELDQKFILPDIQ